MKVNIRISVVFFLFFLTLPVFSNEFKIVNGEETTKEKWEESFSGVVGLLITLSEGMSVCTGTVIDPQMILTARHCVLEDNSLGSQIAPENVDIKSGLWI